ncbi:hypothetical protein [Streptomyces sp. RFCAC02]|uniref:hypothetical protein n=1 Tax=Streptomyces sp. RFCAC02 TaxID=2499143 RepID=UPI0010203A2E|nr:hypothetical protein [Streptomyces sp. RFCAC02]
MTYRIAYDPVAEKQLAAVPQRRRSAFERTLGRTVARDPYGHGSSQVHGDRDRRDATVEGIIIRYYVSGSVLTITIVRLLAV